MCPLDCDRSRREKNGQEKMKLGMLYNKISPNTPKEWLIHPWRFTWNIIMEAWKIMFLSKWVICRFHLNLPGHNEYEVDIWNVICITFLLHWQFHVYLFCILSKPEHTDFTKFIVFFWRLVFRDSKLKQKKSSCSSCKKQLSIFQFQIFSRLSLGTCFSLVMVKKSPTWHDEGGICTKLHHRMTEN